MSTTTKSDTSGLEKNNKSENGKSTLTSDLPNQKAPAIPSKDESPVIIQNDKENYLKTDRDTVKGKDQVKSDKSKKEKPPKKSEAKSKKENASNKKKRSVADNEKPAFKQSNLTDHFPVRRSDRKSSAISKVEERKQLETWIFSGKDVNLEIRDIDEKGRGIVSKKTLKRGDFVCEYAGELIDYDEAKEREERYERTPELGCYMYFFVYKGKKYCVDATPESGRLGRLLNHSKASSNVTTKLFPIDDTPRLILVATTDVPAGTELLYDYGDRSKSAIESHPWLKS